MSSPSATAAAPPRSTVAVVGAGAAGALVAVQLCEAAARRRVPLDLVLVDPAPEAGRGVAYATEVPEHRLNVPVGGMSCYPDDPGHFRRWLCRHGDPTVTPADFASRYRYGSYLADTLGRAVITAHGTVSVRRLRTRATGCADAAGGRVELRLADGGTVTADSVVLATGPAAGRAGWAPAELVASERFVARPWAPGALDGVGASDDVLLVGTGLTAVDLALVLDRPGRTVHAVSRSGLLPQPHAVAPLPPVSPPPGLADLPFHRLRRELTRHFAATRRVHGDWRPALDGLRPEIVRLWQGLTDDERAEFLGRDATPWNVLRHRMAPSTAETVARARAARRLRVHSGRITSTSPAEDGGLVVSLGDGREVRVAWVVDCTGPGLRADAGGDPLWSGLLADGLAVPGPLGIGVSTDHGRLLDAAGHSGRPLFTLGAPRRGELWETTAIPEIRTQAKEIAEAVLAPFTLAPRAVRRRPTDQFGLPLSTHGAAAASFRCGVSRVITVRAKAAEAFARATELDPGFALGHAALALLGHECGADVDVARELADAQRCVRERGDEREQSFVDVVTRRVTGHGAGHTAGHGTGDGDAALVGHLDRFPGDALALGIAVPTIAFSGIADLDGTLALDLVERTAPVYEGHWFHTSLLSFVRQEQGRMEEAGELARAALTAEPASGHAVHALAHVHYESGQHGAGRDWLDGWIGGHGRGAVHRAHFSWHVALHELALDDSAAVRRRWFAQLAPGQVNGVRALVDSGSLLWRARMSRNWTGRVPVDGVLDAVARELVERPATAFTALHSAIALTAAGDLPALRRLRTHAAGADPVQREVVVPLCSALEAVLEEEWATAVRELRGLLPSLRRVGGSAAQREVVEETLLYALVEAGHSDTARHLLEQRLDRRASPLDRRRLAGLPA
ncbi:FAD/NAD(P)-binding protein [Streptomyces sp. NBC_00094]|uniref:FAD/NAD(P)-binding protein n=1 Tax=Streptomyces sp. NBC_00094 TaxID=2903620 RepID=UPI00224F5190|nr:FAD/NAD(P)-binding protein [Streptomyces sp. NBC_00094]MCX5388562.1 FAD/NAD(P)-binding protein [Streptomyces sp. NBC_00094]